jgi:hypothetical protein
VHRQPALDVLKELLLYLRIFHGKCFTAFFFVRLHAGEVC